jgi:methionine biosynthesis protein MetW
MSPVRHDFEEILRLVRPGARVLDVGCGEGVLLDLLRREKGVDGRGIELQPDAVSACLTKGLAVMQGDAERDLAEFPDTSFDYAILSQTLQAMRAPRQVLEALLRLADRAIVSFPNFGHWRVRTSLMLHGRMPETRALPEAAPCATLPTSAPTSACASRPLPRSRKANPPVRWTRPTRWRTGARSRPCSCSAVRLRARMRERSSGICSVSASTLTP